MSTTNPSATPPANDPISDENSNTHFVEKEMAGMAADKETLFPQPPYMIWQGMLDSTRTNDTNLIGDITETEGVVYGAPMAGSDYDDTQTYSYLDTMEEDEKTEAELLAERIQAAAVDVEITEKTIAEKEVAIEEEGPYLDELFPEEPVYNQPNVDYIPMEPMPEMFDNHVTMNPMDQLQPRVDEKRDTIRPGVGDPSATRTRGRGGFVNWDNQFGVAAKSSSREVSSASTQPNAQRPRAEVRRVKFPTPQQRAMPLAQSDSVVSPPSPSPPMRPPEPRKETFPLPRTTESRRMPDNMNPVIGPDFPVLDRPTEVHSEARRSPLERRDPEPPMSARESREPEPTSQAGRPPLFGSMENAYVPGDEFYMKMALLLASSDSYVTNCALSIVPRAVNV
jgi:hypothetical protein